MHMTKLCTFVDRSSVQSIEWPCDRVLFYFVYRDEKVIRRPKRSRNPTTAQARRGFYGAESLQPDTYIPGGIYICAHVWLKREEIWLSGKNTIYCQHVTSISC